MTQTLLLDTLDSAPCALVERGYLFDPDERTHFSEPPWLSPDEAIAAGWTLLGSPTSIPVDSAQPRRGTYIRWAFQRTVPALAEPLDHLLAEVREAVDTSAAVVDPKDLGDKIGNLFVAWAQTLASGDATGGREAMLELVAALLVSEMWIASESKTEG